jgi:hypothetical protein
MKKEMEDAFVGADEELVQAVHETLRHNNVLRHRLELMSVEEMQRRFALRASVRGRGGVILRDQLGQYIHELVVDDFERYIGLKPPRPPLHGLVHVADALPIPTRKAIKALAGDYMHEVQRLQDEGRSRMAKWNVFLAWCCAAWYVLRSPFDWIVSLLLKNLRGSSQ